ncbi:hypothetical protein [Streptomyces mirabilis]|uniref:hypothetical protein n=1 Tax=Streptomyces mirabilis TaxID=68239 RepID=UPI00331F7B4C
MSAPEEHAGEHAGHPHSARPDLTVNGKNANDQALSAAPPSDFVRHWKRHRQVPHAQRQHTYGWHVRHVG